jgi:hypothetical protein
MTRFSSIACASFICMGALAHSQQTARPPFPGQRPGTTTAPQQVSPPTGTAPTGQQPVSPAGVPPAGQQGQPGIPQTPGIATPPTTPAVPPVVTYRDGLLTVQAVNSNLSSVVTAIRNKTGIEFEGAENVSERVAISLGPAPEADVLAAIFSGSKYDYVALARPDSPSIVQKVILTLKSKPGGATEAQGQPRPQVPEGDEEETTDEQVNSGAGDPQDTAVQPPQQVPQQQPPQAETQQPQQPKSPEQLLQELQQMQKQKGAPDDQSTSQAPRKQPPN